MNSYYAIFECSQGPDGLVVRKRLPGEYTSEKKAQDVVRALGGDPKKFEIVWVQA